MHDRRKLSSSKIPRWYRSYSLRRRLLNLLGLIFLTTLVGIGASVYYFIYQNEQRTWQGRQQEAAESASEIVATFIERAEDTLRLIGSIQVNDLINNPQIMPDLLRQNSALLELIRLDARAKPLSSGYQDAPLLANSFTIPQSTWFIQAKAGQLYLDNVQISPDGEPYLIMAGPTPDGGVVATRLRMNVLWEVVDKLAFGKTGQSYIVNAEGQIVAHTEPAVTLAHTSLDGRPEMIALRQAPDHRWSGSYVNFQGAEVIGVTAPVPGTNWVIITEVTEREAFATSRTALLFLGSGLLFVGLAVMLMASRFLNKLVLQPIEQLQAGAIRIGQGDLDYRLEVNSQQQNEVSQVASAFNDMVSRLREREAEVAERTAALTAEITERRQAEKIIAKRAVELEIVTMVGTAAGATLDPNKLLQEVVGLTKVGFGLYHAHIYLLETLTLEGEDQGEVLVLAAGAGQVGQQLVAEGWQIPLNRENSLVARTARTRQGMIVNDVQQDPGFLPNPLLPETRSEMAVPLIVGDKVLGVLDVQSNAVDHFSNEDVRIHTILAGQTAAALENARLYEESQQTAERLREMDRLKSEFLANMSHELRTPLNSIIGYSEMMLMGIDGELSEEMTQNVQAIFDSGNHLLQIINDVLDLAKIEAGRVSLQFDEVPIGGLLDMIKPSIEGLFVKKTVELQFEVEDALPTIQVDSVRIKQIVNNLVSNAVKFTEAGHVALRAFRENGWICLEVEDTGTGMSEEDLGKIFEKFQQVDGSLTRRAEGTGLGLAITRHLTEMHGGDIDVRSQLGQGTTFTVRLPIERSQGDGEDKTLTE